MEVEQYRYAILEIRSMSKPSTNLASPTASPNHCTSLCSNASDSKPLGSPRPQIL